MAKPIVKEVWEWPIMKEAGKRLGHVIAVLHDTVEVGITPLDIDRIAEEEMKKLQSRPAFKGYKGFPNTVCSSINDAVVHGIPDDRPFEDGDVVSLDFGLNYGGYFADSAFTVALGTPSEDVARLLEGTQAALLTAIEACRPGANVGDIGSIIEQTCKIYGLGILRNYTGHGIGRDLHEPPEIPNFGIPGMGEPLKIGMCICIEPMTTLGGEEVKTLDDGWTVVTADGSLSAHFEHMILITPNGPQVLTALPA